MTFEFCREPKAEIAAWVEDRSGGDGVPPEPYAAFGWRYNGRLIAGAVYNRLRKGCDVTVAIAGEPLAARKGILKAGLDYAFVTCGVPRITAEVAEDNRRCRKLIEGLGFKIEGRKRKAGPTGQDVLVYGLLQEERTI